MKWTKLTKENNVPNDMCLFLFENEKYVPKWAHSFSLIKLVHDDGFYLNDHVLKGKITHFITLSELLKLDK